MNHSILRTAFLAALAGTATVHGQQASTSPAKPAAPAPAAASTTLEPVVVTAASEEPGARYEAPVENSASLKTEIPVLETPQAVSVIGEQLIKDQGSPKLERVLQNVAGVSAGGYYGEWDYYRLRGFDAAFNTYFNGLRGDYGMNAETFGLERVEVIKGPASTLYGQAPLGGIVNLVSKRPKREFGGEVGFTAGSWDSYEGTLDINVPLVSPYGASAAAAPAPAVSGKGVVSSKNPVSAPLVETSTPNGFGAYFRLNALYRDKGSFQDYYDFERTYIAPSLTLDFGRDTSLTILMDYTKDDGIFAMPLPARGTVVTNPNGWIPIERFIGIPGKTSMVEQETLRLGYEFRHHINDIFTIRQNFRYTNFDQKWTAPVYPSSLSADQRTLYGYPYGFDKDERESFAVDTALDAVFNTGSVKNTLTVGFDFYHTDDDSRSSQIDYADFPGSYVALDLYRPNYNIPLPGYSTHASSSETQEGSGIYLQEHAKLTDTVSLTLGGRYDFVRRTADGNVADDESFSPKAGLTWEFLPGVAAYTNYSRSFQPQWFSTDASGAPVEPEEGENWEAGVKYSLFDGKVTGMISAFQLTRENVATSNIATADPFDATVSGEQRSRGFEFEAAAELAPGLSLTTAYTYLDAEVTEDNDIPAGTPLIGVPDHTISAWLKYQLQDGPLKGFGVGVGGRYLTSQSGDTYHTFDIPEYGLLDAALFYERERFRAQVNFNNILDRRHFVGSYNDLYVLPGAPFNVSASLTVKF